MVVVYCVISFILGWRLSSWAKSEPFARARQARQGFSSAESSQLAKEQEVEQQVVVEVQDDGLEQGNEDGSGAWFFDGSYLDDDPEHCHDDSTAQAERYFIDNFHDESQLQSQRLTALKAALSMNESLLDGVLVEEVYKLLVKADESQHPDDISYMLSLMQGRVGSEKLPGLAIYLKSPSAAIREEALKAIFPLDSKGLYRKHVEHILNNDPQVELRALAFSLLEPHCNHLRDSAA